MDFLQLLACVGILTGIYLYGQNSRWAPIVSCLSCLICFVLTAAAGLPWMAALNAGLAGMHFFNFVKGTHHDAII